MSEKDDGKVRTPEQHVRSSASFWFVLLCLLFPYDDFGMRTAHLIHRCLCHHRSPVLATARYVHRQTHETSQDYPERDDDGKSHNSVLYDGHIPTTGMQKLILAAGSSLMSLIDPWRHDMVAVSGETTGHYALQGMMRRMRESQEGRDILTERPIINSMTVDFDQLKDMPHSTFGHQYAEFMDRNKITPDSRDPVKFVDDPDLAYVMQRYRQVHDLVHCLLGMRTDMLGEVTVKWVEAVQTDLPMTWGAAVFGAVRLSPQQRKKYVTTHLPWAMRCGHEASFIYNVYFERRWSQDICDLRREVNIPKVLQ